ncbi:MAG: hypothetical protein ACRENN_11875 [Candidatus Eiseniibacteriota bacterium]
MALTMISGNATNVNFGSDFTYAATSNHGPVPIKNQIVSLRVDQKPIHFRTRSLPSISDGDTIAAAGTMKNGTLEAVALRNLTSGAFYHPPTTMVMVGSIALIVLGIPLIAFLGFGLFFIGVGAWMLTKVFNIRNAVTMLQSAGGGAVNPA